MGHDLALKMHYYGASMTRRLVHSSVTPESKHVHEIQSA
jgi:hypothetical protein